MKMKLWLSLSAGVIAGILGTASAAHAQRIFQTDVSGVIPTTGDPVYGFRRDLVYINNPVRDAVQLEADYLRTAFMNRTLTNALSCFPPNIDNEVESILYSVLTDDANAARNAELITNALIESGADADEVQDLVDSLWGLLEEDYIEPDEYQDAVENFNEMLRESDNALFASSPQILFAIHTVLFHLNDAAYFALDEDNNN